MWLVPFATSLAFSVLPILMVGMFLPDIREGETARQRREGKLSEAEIVKSGQRLALVFIALAIILNLGSGFCFWVQGYFTAAKSHTGQPLTTPDLVNGQVYHLKVSVPVASGKEYQILLEDKDGQTRYYQLTQEPKAVDFISVKRDEETVFLPLPPLVRTSKPE